MKLRNKIATGLLALAALTLVAAPSNAQAAPVFTLDTTAVPGYDEVWAAADWSKNTGVTVVPGSCSTGPYCIKVSNVSFACGRAYPIGGCAYRTSLAEGGYYQVEVSEWVWGRGYERYLDDLILKHEAGHCIWGALGYSQSAHLPDKPHALMSSTHSTGPTKKEATLTSVDRQFTRNLVTG
jgi:hypothetical protein